MSDVKEEIEEMIKTFDGGPADDTAQTPEPEQKAEPEPSPEPSPVPVPEPKPEPVDESTPEPEPKATPEPEPAVKQTPPEDERDRTISELRAKLAEKESVKEPPKPIEEPLKLDEQDFVGDTDLDDLMRDPKEFNKFVNKVYQKAVTDSHGQVSKKVFDSLPNVIKEQIVVMTNLQRMSEEFYEENSDLKPFKKVVAAVFEETVAKDPSRNYSEVMKDVGPEVRKRLELDKKSTPTEPVKDTPPRLPRKGGKAGQMQTKPTLEPLQAELEEMNKVIGR